MAKFTYRLQPVLNVKKQMEDGLKNELGKAVQKLECEKNILVGFEQERQACFKEISGKTGTPVVVGELKQYTAYLSVLRGRIITQKENINSAQHHVDMYREQLVRVMQEKEMLEKLREKKYRNFVCEDLRREQSQADEVVSFKLNKRENEE